MSADEDLETPPDIVLRQEKDYIELGPIEYPDIRVRIYRPADLSHAHATQRKVVVFIWLLENFMEIVAASAEHGEPMQSDEDAEKAAAEFSTLTDIRDILGEGHDKDIGDA